jgi:AraC family transcriptional regulator, dual regulator of chb operon
LDSGFDNLSHFYHLFKRKFNASPKEFREKHQKSIIPI